MPTINSINNSTKVTSYDAAGTYTWTKDTRTSLVEIIMWGGGGGGGSGRRATSTTSGGGGGGSACSCVHTSVLSTFLGLSETIVVGAGGAGGVAQTVDNTDGNIGIQGTSSSFGALTTKTSNPGVGGKNALANAGGSLPSNIFQYTAAFSTSTVGDGLTTDGRTPTTFGGTNLNICTLSASSGGGGAGADSVTVRTGGSGGSITNFVATALISGGAGGVETGTIDGAAGSNQLTSTSGGIMTGGTGGGGGGGGSLNGTNSGAGGKGGDGRVIVIEYF